jgi:hypothetical protein
VDGTRRVQKAAVYTGPLQALNRLLNSYQRDPWIDQPVHVEVWGEKDAISSTVLPETLGLDVGLYITRGFTSDTFVQLTAAKEIAVINKPTMIYSLIDWDKAGGHIEDTMIAKLREHAPNVKIEIKRLAVYAEQIAEYDLNTRPPKSQAEINAGYSECVEVDAIRPDILRGLVRDAVRSQIDPEIERRAEAAQAQDIEELSTVVYDAKRRGEGATVDIEEVADDVLGGLDGDHAEQFLDIVRSTRGMDQTDLLMLVHELAKRCRPQDES